MQIFTEPAAGIGFAAGFLLAIQGVGFAVSHRLRPTWGLQWIALSMGLAAVRALVFAAGFGGTFWPAAPALLAAASLAALLTGLQRYVGLTPRRPILTFVLAVLAWLALRELLTAAGTGPLAGPLASGLVFTYMAALCTGLLRPVAGGAYPMAAAVLLANPALVLGVGAGWLGLDLQQLRGWAALGTAIVGLGLMMAGMGRLRLELEAELARRCAAEGALRALNESLESRVQERTAELEELATGLQSFNSMVSHDLRGPLGGLSGLCELTLQMLRRGEMGTVEKYLDLMRAETRRLGHLVAQLLQLAGVGHVELVLADTPLDAVLADAMQALSLSQDAAALACVKAAPLPHVQVDAALLNQVFVNLVGNALKFADARRPCEVLISSTANASRCVVEVRDNGAGFEQARAAELFLPFRRLHGDEIEGSGIGLSIVRRIVERHGGRVWAEGRPGRGASFFFSLPLHGPLVPLTPQQRALPAYRPS